MIASPERSITSVRERIRSLLAEAAASGGADLLVLAVDGIGFSLAAEAWPAAETECLRSVFPTTSSTAWLSSLTGDDVSSHGIPGVAFAGPDGELINLYAFNGPLGSARRGNIFSDAAEARFSPMAVLGDLAGLDCSWRELLLDGAMRCGRQRLFGAPDVRPSDVSPLLEAGIREAVAAGPAPRLIWCFIDADLYIHRHGYDEAMLGFLRDIEALALAFAAKGTIVAAHSDHGLVPTRHDPGLATLLQGLEPYCERPMGGAGRTRWLYPRAGSEPLVEKGLASLPAEVRVAASSDYFRPGSAAHSRAGSILLIAEGEHFLAPDAYRYEHGSLTAGELDVPFAIWRP